MLNKVKLNINIPRPQRIRLNKLAPWLNLVAHEHGEDAVGFDGVVDLDAQEAADCWVHGGFPELGGVHLAQPFVALAAGGALGLGQQPLHGDAEVADAFFFLALAFTAHDLGTVAQQAAEGVGGFGQGGVVGAVDEVLRQNTAFHIAVVAAADA
jgi:hypothetical protein